MSHSLLVIDDDASTCELLAETLSPRFDVAWTTEPRRAEELVRGRAFDVVLTDVRMEGVDGIELCARMVEAYPNLPVVVMTAFGSIDTAVTAMRAGASDFLTKPFELGAVMAVLTRALDRSGHRRPGHCIERAVVLTRSDCITRDDLPEKVRAYRPEPTAPAALAPLELVALEEVERRYILRVLDAVHGNKSKAALVLGLDRKTLYRRLERYARSGDEPRAAT